MADHHFSGGNQDLPSESLKQQPAAHVPAVSLGATIDPFAAQPVALTDEELHRADYQAIREAGFQDPGELLDAYQKLTAAKPIEAALPPLSELEVHAAGNSTTLALVTRYAITYRNAYERLVESLEDAESAAQPVALTDEKIAATWRQTYPKAVHGAPYEFARALLAQAAPSAKQSEAPPGLVERLRRHSEDRKNTAFARSTMMKSAYAAGRRKGLEDALAIAREYNLVGNAAVQCVVDDLKKLLEK